MKNNFFKSFIAAASVPVVILLLMAVAPLFTILFGKEIALKTEPYDPRDLFRGDHVILNYKINNVDSSKLSADLTAKLNGQPYEKIKNKRVYAVLVEHDGYFDIDHITDKRPKSSVYLICRLKYYDQDNKTVQLDYNLDKYFVPENTGGELEKLSRSGELTARIKVFYGYALLEKVVGNEK